jgi:hypothetical protein
MYSLHRPSMWFYGPAARPRGAWGLAGRGAVLRVCLLLASLPLRPASLMREVAPRETAPSTYYDAFSTRLFDPQGRVLQLEYALEVTKKGGAAVSP